MSSIENSGIAHSSSVDSVLAQMRVLQQQASQLPGAAELQAIDAGTVAATAAPSKGFSTLFAQALSSVNELQQNSSSLAKGFVQGEHNDLVAASIASQKSSLAFQAVVTARNRMVAAYQDIMNMPI